MGDETGKFINYGSIFNKNLFSYFKGCIKIFLINFCNIFQFQDQNRKNSKDRFIKNILTYNFLLLKL